MRAHRETGDNAEPWTYVNAKLNRQAGRRDAWNGISGRTRGSPFSDTVISIVDTSHIHFYNPFLIPRTSNTESPKRGRNLRFFLNKSNYNRRTVLEDSFSSIPICNAFRVKRMPMIDCISSLPILHSWCMYNECKYGLNSIRLTGDIVSALFKNAMLLW